MRGVNSGEVEIKGTEEPINGSAAPLSFLSRGCAAAADTEVLLLLLLLLLLLASMRLSLHHQ